MFYSIRHSSRPELCGLRIEHIDVDRKAIFISKGKGQEDRLGPGRASRLLWIARYVEKDRDKLQLDPKKATLFLTKDGKPLNPDSLTEYARKYVQIRRRRKDQRRIVTSPSHDGDVDARERGGLIRYIQAILGHERLDTTQIYTRTSLTESCWKSTAKRTQLNGPRRMTPMMIRGKHARIGRAGTDHAGRITIGAMLTDQGNSHRSLRNRAHAARGDRYTDIAAAMHHNLNDCRP